MTCFAELRSLANPSLQVTKNAEASTALQEGEQQSLSGSRSCDLRCGARLRVTSTSNRAHRWSSGRPLLLVLLRRWSELRSSVLGHAAESML